jgi:3-oxoacyl-[acyl-carrier-protein] synthase-3
MIGISEIASYIPNKKISNLEKMNFFGVDEYFIKEKIGIEEVSIKERDEKSSDLCIHAYNNLLKKINICNDSIDVVVVITQNPDYNIPHASALLHNKLQLKDSCACFDISLGCSGFVQGLAIVKSFMESYHFKNGLLFTSDQYSDIINKSDKDTSLIFGDAATVTLLTDKPTYSPLGFSFGTSGKYYDAIIKDGQYLSMKGRKVFNFVMTAVPNDIEKLMKNFNLDKKDIDCFILHQGSKYIVDMLAKQMEIPPSKVPFDITHYGNTVSSSIPIILEKQWKKQYKYLLLSGFGVGLSFANAILQKETVENG